MVALRPRSEATSLDALVVNTSLAWAVENVFPITVAGTVGYGEQGIAVDIRGDLSDSCGENCDHSGSMQLIAKLSRCRR